MCCAAPRSLLNHGSADDLLEEYAVVSSYGGAENQTRVFDPRGDRAAADARASRLEGPTAVLTSSLHSPRHRHQRITARQR